MYRPSSEGVSFAANRDAARHGGVSQLNVDRRVVVEGAHGAALPAEQYHTILSQSRFEVGRVNLITSVCVCVV